MHPFVKDVGKFVIDCAQEAYVVAAKATGLIDYPVPPNSNMRRTSSSWITHYYQSGINTGLPIATACRLHRLDLRPGTRVLDFGAGVGRQVRFFSKEFPGLKLFACDVEKSHIDWLTNAYPSVECHQSNYLPPLKFGDASLDLIYSVSIFSHITKEHASLWLNEFARIVRPGGMACLTTLGLTANRIAGSKEERSAALRDFGHHHEDYTFITEAKRRSASARLIRQTEMASSCDESYGRTYYTADYVCQHWPSAKWSIAGIAEGVIDGLQDLVVLKRN
jgi:ubiquinone/menaquinone biosynthesis C-methylase UbiE